MNESHTADNRPGDADVQERLIDCGRASDLTRGVPLMLLFELGWPPNNKMFLV